MSLLKIALMAAVVALSTGCNTIVNTTNLKDSNVSVVVDSSCTTQFNAL